MPKTGVPFNPNRNFAEVHGMPGVAVEQVGADGVSRLYSPGPTYRRVLTPGQELEDIAPAAKERAETAPVKERGKPGRKPGSAKKAAEPPAKPQRMGRAAAMGKQPTVDAYPITVDDLTAWGKNEKEIPFVPDLANAFLHHFEREPEDEVEARLILIEQGLIEEGDVETEAKAEDADE